MPSMIPNWGQDRQRAKTASFDPVPEGEYNVTCIKSEPTQSSTGKPMIKTTWQVEDGPSVGKKVFNQFVYSADSDVALAIFFQHMSFMGLDDAFFDANPAWEQVAQMILGRRCRFQVGIRDYQGQARNDVKKVLPPMAPMDGVTQMPQMGQMPQVPQMPQVAQAPAPVMPQVQQMPVQPQMPQQMPQQPQVVPQVQQPQPMQPGVGGSPLQGIIPQQPQAIPQQPQYPNLPQVQQPVQQPVAPQQPAPVAPPIPGMVPQDAQQPQQPEQVQQPADPNQQNGYTTQQVGGFTVIQGQGQTPEI